MTSTYRTWLVVRKNDPALGKVVKMLRQFNLLDLKESPVVSLQASGDNIVLKTRDAKAVFNDVFDARESGPVRALSLAPYRDIRLFQDKAFRFEGGYYRVGSEGYDVKPQSDPYLRRFLRFAFVTSGVQPSRDTERSRIEPGDADGPALFFNPELVSLDEGQANLLFAGRGAALADVSGGSFLPAVRTQDHRAVGASYFAEALVDLRWALAACTRLDVMRKDEPAAVRIWRLMDDPLVRDVLLDGGSFRVCGGEGEPTTLELHVWEGDDPVSSYRALTLLEPGRVPGPPWARNLAVVLRNDILGLIPESFEIVPATTPVSWAIPATHPYVPGAREGTWTRLVRLKDELAMSHQAGALTLAERVTEPARERLHVLDGVKSTTPSDHDLAERLFILNAWRNPWSTATDSDPWRLAMVELLSQELAGVHVTPQERVTSWREHDHSFKFVQRPGNAPILRYSGKATDEEMLKWRLLLPLGTIVKGRTLHLDETECSRLDAGFVLA